MNEFNKRMSILNKGKSKIIDTILRLQPDVVLDLGAGQCVIGLELAKKGYSGHIIAVDKEISKTFTKKDKNEVYTMSLGDFVDQAEVQVLKHKKVAIVLSAVLHELDIDEYTKVQTLVTDINQIAADLTVFIREPYYDDKLIYRPICPDFAKDEKFNDYRLENKKSWAMQNGIPLDVMYMNYLFLLAYGPDSWDREKSEGRFTFSLEQIQDFIASTGLSVVYKYYERDEMYKNIPVRYSSCLFVCGRKER